MLNRDEKYIYDWETKRGKGKWSYLFLTAFIWGTLIPVLITAFKLAFKGLLSFSNLKSEVLTREFLPTWIKFVAGFFFFALFMWHLAKKKYQELKHKQKSEHKEIQMHRNSSPDIPNSRGGLAD